MATAHVSGRRELPVSHETIYRSLFIQARGALKKELLEHLRRTRAMRRSRHHTQKTDDHGRIRDTVSISERPATVEDRAVPGHWEVTCCAEPIEVKLRPLSNGIPLRDAGEDLQQRFRDGHQCSDQKRSQVAAGALQIADLGSGSEMASTSDSH